ncbi:MAG: phage minor head protein [Meiothermus sp.]|uniref:phage head morphogenesis protein n=1 Tax=Meiothermus sp. TaxID=1955249 RepID=UPI0025F7B0DC|nr:phage minor head protein [Meiothermus sp.]MCS7069087.1 phage head morphogenesis protein [Meiothermus sp.]MCX7802267.1 phage head morphogenesis protein [Meiothermus ruber]MDW8426483.1 phage minor head protein [Meiothermus sp.]
MWKVSANPVQPEEAIAWFRARLPLPKAEWQALEERARRKAFTVAGVVQLDLLAEVWESLSRALEQGIPYAEWAKEMRGKLEAAWGRKDSARLEIIFRTNVQMAYASGRWAQMEAPEVKQARPYRMYDAVLDSRTTSICKTRHGTVLPADDPWWNRNWPPLHFNCRSGVRALTELEARQRGITERPTSSAPQAGFGNAPQTWEWSPDPKDYDPRVWAAYIQALGTAFGRDARRAAEARARLAAIARGEVEAAENDAPSALALVAVGEFPQRPVKVRDPEVRALLGEEAPRLLQKLIQHAIIDQQFRPDLSPERYLEILRRAAIHPGAAVVVHAPPRGPVALVIAPSEVVGDDLGPEAEPWIVVVYDLTHGTLVTGYLASSLEAISLWPKRTWLRNNPQLGF